MSNVEKDVKQKRFEVFKGSLDRVEKVYGRNVTGYLFGVGGKTARFEIDRKVRDPSMASARLPGRSDILAIQLLELLIRDGYKLDEFEFDDQERLIRAPRN
ncbi:hypothetical protein EZI54_07475 [Marinobacter halodurans]|uniref:Uncharacterized protein n=1 Tax=Marinobacter halodurans TaxID=2528979 RepID=A0ABY1ZQ22_9GAMM|nr:hypothetical protein [Marinobacter halodurans]TBW57492.1 hypothetical protein EZI54_07475 [Marinobacter halodurans]